MVDQARARKIASRIREIIAADLGQIVKDPDLGFVTITDVRVTGDLQHASVFYTVYGDDDQRVTSSEILQRNVGKLRSHVGGRLGIRLTPTLELIPAGLPESASHLDDVLRKARERDVQLAAAASGASYAAGEDPYKRPAEDDEADARD